MAPADADAVSGLSELAAVVESGIRDSIAVHEQFLEASYVSELIGAADMISGSLLRGGKLLLFGNGGSASDAAHVAAEFVGRFQRERTALPAISLATNASALTAIANDYGFDRVFARQVEALGAPGDVAVAISTSGKSRNVIEGVQAARRLGLGTIGLTGAEGNDLAVEVDICLQVPSSTTARIQEGHILVAHVLCELVERELA